MNHPPSELEIDAPPTPSWWTTPTTFYEQAARFAREAKIAGDSGLPPALATYLHDKDLCEARAMAEIPAPIRR